MSNGEGNPIVRAVKESSVWRSLFRQPYPTTSRTRALAVMNNVFLHLHPVRVKKHAVRYTYTFCLGGLSFFLHMIRVFYHGAYKPPREFNWAIGVLLLFSTLWLSFTGYLLPWDQIAFWAITVGTQMATYAPLLNTESSFILLGGIEVGQETLIRFYVMHVIAFPLIAAILMVVHFWRIRKDGGISGPV